MALKIMEKESRPVDLSRIKAEQLISVQGLALLSAGKNDAWLALNAQLSADIMAIQFALYESKDKSENIADKVNEIWNDVIAAVSAFVADSSEALISEIITNYRAEILTHLDVYARESFLTMVSPSENYGTLFLNKSVLSESFGIAYFGKGSSDVLSARKKWEAEKLYVEYYALKDDSLPAAFSALYQADMLTLEAWLINAGKLVGDDSRVSIAMKFALTNAYLQQLDGIPTNKGEYELLIRGAMVRGLGLHDGESFARSLPELLD